MLRLSLRSLETFNEKTQQFENVGGIDVELEHSLYTVAKWEGTHKEVFTQSDMTFDFIMSYVKVMCLTDNVPDSAWVCMTREQLSDVIAYINDKPTATKIKKNDSGHRSQRIVTAELIYYWMFTLQIPLECEHWHFNRLMTLIEVSSIESTPKKKMGKKTAMQQQRELNAMRRAKFSTKG